MMSRKCLTPVAAQCRMLVPIAVCVAAFLVFADHSRMARVLADPICRFHIAAMTHHLVWCLLVEHACAVRHLSTFLCIVSSRSCRHTLCIAVIFNAARLAV